jgi:hypothetical protein
LPGTLTGLAAKDLAADPSIVPAVLLGAIAPEQQREEVEAGSETSRWVSGIE